MRNIVHDLWDTANFGCSFSNTNQILFVYYCDIYCCFLSFTPKNVARKLCPEEILKKDSFLVKTTETTMIIENVLLNICVRRAN